MKINYKNNNGIALIAVVGTLLVLTVVVASSTIMSQNIKYASNSGTIRNKAAYIAESAASRIQWLIIQDKIKFSNRTIKTTASDLDTEEEERFLADGSFKELNDYYDANVSYAITDMFSGINIAGSKPSKSFKPLIKKYALDEEKRDNFEIFINKVKDYIDKDDFLNKDGMESQDYNSLELGPLPRNNNFQYREEILLIPGYEEFFKQDSYGRLSAFNIIPPKGMRISNKKPNFYSADDNIISYLTSFEEDAIERIIDARNEWFTSRTDISETLEPDEISALKKHFSFKESGYFTIIIKVSLSPDCTNRTLFISLKIDKKLPKDNISFYDWTIH